MSVWLEVHLAFKFSFLILSFGRSWLSLFLWSQSGSVPFFIASHHLVTRTEPCGDVISPQGSPSAFWGVASVAGLHLLGYISISCAINCCYKKQLKIFFFICVPSASEVKTWEYTFDPVLLCNLNLFHHLTLLTYYHKNGFNLQRYTTVWIWIYRNDMVCLSTVMNS